MKISNFFKVPGLLFVKQWPCFPYKNVNMPWGLHVECLEVTLGQKFQRFRKTGILFEISLELQRVKKNSSRMHLFGPIQFIQCSFQCCVLLVCGTCRKPLAGQKKVADTEKAKTTNIYKLGEEQRIQNLISGSLGEEPLQPLKI